MNKKDVKWLVLAIALYLAVGASACAMAQHRTEQMQEELSYQEYKTRLAEGERDNALASREQWKAMYMESLKEIAALKAENEELTRQAEELSFALDEVCAEAGWTRLGTFRVTYYCPCEKCCGKWSGGLTAGGTVPTEGRTVAVDPDVVPLGTRLRINGHEYVAEDTGVSGHAVDIFVSDHEEALRLGTYKATVEREAA